MKGWEIALIIFIIFIFVIIMIVVILTVAGYFKDNDIKKKINTILQGPFSLQQLTNKSNYVAVSSAGKDPVKGNALILSSSSTIKCSNYAWKYNQQNETLEWGGMVSATPDLAAISNRTCTCITPPVHRVNYPYEDCIKDFFGKCVEGTINPPLSDPSSPSTLVATVSTKTPTSISSGSAVILAPRGTLGPTNQWTYDSTLFRWCLKSNPSLCMKNDSGVIKVETVSLISITDENFGWIPDDVLKSPSCA